MLITDLDELRSGHQSFVRFKTPSLRMTSAVLIAQRLRLVALLFLALKLDIGRIEPQCGQQGFVWSQGPIYCCNRFVPASII